MDTIYIAEILSEDAVLCKHPILLYHLLKCTEKSIDTWQRQYERGDKQIVELIMWIVKIWRNSNNRKNTTDQILVDLLKKGGYILSAELIEHFPSQQKILNSSVDEPSLFVNQLRFGLNQTQTDFYGRLRELDLLSTFTMEKDVIKIAVVGPPGIGKSTLVKKFILDIRQGAHYIWIKFAKFDKKIQAFNKEYFPHSQIHQNENDFKNQFNMNLKVFCQNIDNFHTKNKILFVIDEIYEVDDFLECAVRKIVGTNKIICILISRNTDILKLKCKEVYVGQLTNDDAVQLARNIFNCDHVKAKEICENFQNYPLLLGQSSAYYSYQQPDLSFTIDKLFEDLETNPKSILDHNLTGTDKHYNRNLKTFTIVKNYHNHMNAIEKRVFQILSYIPSTGVPFKTIKELLMNSREMYSLDWKQFNKYSFVKNSFVSIDSAETRIKLLPMFKLTAKLLASESEEEILYSILSLLKKDLLKWNKKEKFVSIVPLEKKLVIVPYINETELIVLWNTAINYIRLVESFKEVIIWIPTVNHSESFLKKSIEQLKTLLNLEDNHVGLLQIRRRLAQIQFMEGDKKNLKNSLKNYKYVINHLEKSLNESVELYGTLEEYAWVLASLNEYEEAILVLNKTIKGHTKKAGWDNKCVIRVSWCKAQLMLENINQLDKKQAYENLRKVNDWYKKNHWEYFLNFQAINQDVSNHMQGITSNSDGWRLHWYYCLGMIIIFACVLFLFIKL